MMWRMLAIYLVAEEARNAKGGPQIGFVLEQPADPRKYMPGCPTFWGTTQWEAFEEMEGMAEYEFYQGHFGGAAQKPTTLGTNLYIDLPERRVTGPDGRGGHQRLEEPRKVSSGTHERSGESDSDAGQEAGEAAQAELAGAHRGGTLPDEEGLPSLSGGEWSRPTP